jgi:phosphatidylserine decarboxylase
MQEKSPTTNLAATDSTTDATIVDYLKAWPQYPLPHNWLTTLMYKLMRSRLPWWKNNFIRWFIRQYNVDLSEAVESNPANFEHFNAFFTRALKPQARIIHSAENNIICPVDGAISQFGDITAGNIFQAKGRAFDVETLLAKHEPWVTRFQSGKFITIYLSPKDYHRIHLPTDGVLTAMRYVPGRLFSVNPATTRAVPDLFARNERLICAFDTPHGKLLLIMVGALFVSGIETVWHGEVSPPHGAKLMHRDYSDDNNNKTEIETDAKRLTFSAGDEVGRFNMGSTVILLFEPNSIDWDDSLAASKSVKMGSLLGTVNQEK